MKSDKYHCPKCKLLFDSMNHFPRILPSCNHSLCSYCINEEINKKEKHVICPIDNILYEKISNINFFKENQNLIEQLQEKLNIPFNHNYEISNDDEIFFDKSGIIMNSDKFSDTNNSLNLNINSSIISSSHCYYKKSKDIRNILIANNNQICSSHSLPLNIICIDERKKICSQCALNNEHVNHQILTEIEFMNNIDSLIDLFHEVDNNQIKYLNYNNINTKLILDKISNKINTLIKIINSTKEDIINNINKQCEKIENYLTKRKEEILVKYQSTDFDISTLRDSTLNWMQLVTNKLDQLNEIKEPSKGCVNLLNDDDNIDKNIFNLIRNGKQLNGRYNFVQETIKIIQKLENFDKNGIEIKPNFNIIDTIFFKENNKTLENQENKDDVDINLNIEEEGKKNNIINKLNEENKENKENNNNYIQSSLFDIEENKEIINSLHLSQYKFELLDDNIIIQEKKENNIIENDNNQINIKQEKEINKNISNTSSNEKEKDNDIILNINIDEIKQEIKNEEKNKNIINNENNVINKNDLNEKNNISKIIDDLSFNDDTLLINSLLLNQNDTIYHKKIKKDYPIDLKNPNKKKEKEKEKEEDKEKEKEKEKPKITTKKIDLSELNKNNNNNNNKINEEKNNKKMSNKNNKNSFITKNSFNANINKNLDINNPNNENDNNKNPINVNVINNNKNEIVINFTKKISSSKKNKPICSNYMKSEKKTIFGKIKANVESSPLIMSRSPGRLNCQSKLEGFYSFVPLEKINQKQIELNQYKTNHKTLISSKDFTDFNNECSSNTNIRRNTLVNTNITKVNKKMKTKNDFSSKIIKKINSSKINSNLNNENISVINKENNNRNYMEHYNNLININNNLNNNNSFETKSKKDLQEFITNQLKNINPNFSRINMSGYGIQYLCSFLHKNPNMNYKEIKLLGCNLNDDDLFILTRTLLDHDIKVIILNISSNKISDDSASNILDILKDCKSLKGLALYNNMISNLLKDKLKDYVKLGRENYDMVQLYI